MEIRYGVGTLAGLVWADMSVTSLLQDGSPGDTSTGVSASDSDTLGSSVPCLVASPLVSQVVEIRYTTAQICTSWRGNATLTLNIANGESACSIPTTGEGEPPFASTGGSGSAALYYWTGSAWVLLDTWSLTVPAGAFSATTTQANSSGVRSVTSTQACRWRVVFTHSQTWVGVLNVITASTNITDLRLTVEDTAIACDTDGGGDGDGGGGGGGEDSGSCGCDGWTRAALCSPAGARASLCSPLATRSPLCSPAATRRRC